jgi:SPP1 family predicted phage head-tail adaptor
VLRAGVLDEQAVIKTPTESFNELNEPILTFTKFADRMIAIMPLSGSENMQAMSREGTVMHRIRMHYTAGLKPKMRIEVGSRVFEIMSVMERGRKVEHEVLATEVTD